MAEEKIREQVREIIFKNMVSGYSRSAQTNFHYTKPSPTTYPFQFFWDTCFHVYILTALGAHEMAKKHLNSLFSLQKEDGFVGHMIYWDRLWPGRFTDFFQSKPDKNLFRSHMSALIQPPLAAQALQRVYEVTQDKSFLLQLLPKLKKYYHWLAQNRDFSGDGLLSIISPFESGLDWKPTFDPVVGFPEKQADWRLFCKVVWVDMRNFWHRYNYQTIYRKNYFQVKEVGFNTIYVQNLLAMASLCRLLSDPDETHYRELAAKVTQSMQAIFYDAEQAAFLDVYGVNNTKIHVLTPTIFFPVVIPGIPDSISKQIIEKHFLNEHEFATPFPIPSVAVNHPSFNQGSSIYIWRGPTWIMFSWFMHQFLIKKGYTQEAGKLVESIKTLIYKSGFREYYNPYTGEGYGAQEFTWSGLVVDMMNMAEGIHVSDM